MITLVNSISRYFYVHPERYVELQNALILLLLSVFVLSHPAKLEVSTAYDLFLVLGAEKSAVIFLMGVIGVVRIAALIINGAWRRSPLIRGGCSIASAGMLIIVGFSFWPAIPLAITDVISAYKAGVDARAASGK